MQHSNYSMMYYNDNYYNKKRNYYIEKYTMFTKQKERKSTKYKYNEKKYCRNMPSHCYAYKMNIHYNPDKFMLPSHAASLLLI